MTAGHAFGKREFSEMKLREMILFFPPAFCIVLGFGLILGEILGHNRDGFLS